MATANNYGHADWPEYTELGKVGYDAYGKTADWKNYEGKPMPQWDELPEHIRAKWSIAAKAIVKTNKEKENE